MRPPRAASLPRLEIDASGPSAASARLADFVWPHPVPDRAIHAGADGSRALVQSRLLDDAGRRVRWVEHADIGGDEPGGIDHGGDAIHRTELVRFDLDATRFAETGRWRVDDRGEMDDHNLHRHAVVLPAVMNLGERALPIPGAGVTLDWCGEAELRLGEETIRRRVIRLRMEQGGMRMDQWLAAGIGEIATGAAWGPFTRWLLAWEGDGRTWWGGVPPQLTLDTVDWESAGYTPAR